LQGKALVSAVACSDRFGRSGCSRPFLGVPFLLAHGCVQVALLGGLGMGTCCS